MTKSIAIHFKTAQWDKIVASVSQIAKGNNLYWIYPQQTSEFTLALSKNDSAINALEDAEIDRLVEILGDLPSATLCLELRRFKQNIACEQATDICQKILQQFEGVVDDGNNKLWTLEDIESEIEKNTGKFLDCYRQSTDLLIALEKTIKTAFKNVKYPGDNNISAPTYDDEGTTEYFCGKTWLNHSVTDLRQHQSALSFFTDGAYHYYLPAFMLACIENFVEADVICDHICMDFSPPKSNSKRLGFKRKMDYFTKKQKYAVRFFLEYLADIDGDDFFTSEAMNYLLTI